MTNGRSGDVQGVENAVALLPLLADMTTGERRWWCFGSQHEEDLCEDYHTKDLAGAVLSELPRHGGWIDEKEIEML